MCARVSHPTKNRARQFGRHRNERGSRRGPNHAHYAAIDLGTNNCRMLIARPSGSSFTVVDSFSRIVRLGEGVSAYDRLGDDAIDRTLSALRVCAGKLHSAGVKQIRAVATEACRRADNGPDFIKSVQDVTGIALEIISAQEEARLTLEGCLPLLDPKKPYALIFDIGGGSTEIIWVAIKDEGPEVLGILSQPHGVVTVAEDFGHDENPDHGYDEIVALLDAGFDDFDTKHQIAQAVADGKVQMLGTSGTVTTLGGIHLNLDRYNRSKVDGLHLNFTDINRLSNDLKNMPLEQRADHPCIGPQRADLMLAGCAILEAVRKRWPVGRLRVADRGIREGLLLGMMRQDKTKNKKDSS